MSEERGSAELLRLLGPAGLIRLAEAYGGTRLYVPVSTERTELVNVLGQETTARLVGRHGREYIKVPLARELRARHYRAADQSNAEIARRLGMTETGVERLFQAMPNKPSKGGGDPRQLKLFG